MKKTTSKKLTRAQKSELNKLNNLSDKQINTTDIPELKNWNDKKRGLFYRPIKKQITLRLDADLIEWFKNKIPGKKGYQTSINRALREYIALMHE